MATYLCPLCKQEVTQSIYEQITGIWQEKEKQLQELRKKEKELKTRELNLRKKFEEDKKKFAAIINAKYKTELASKMRATQKSMQIEREKLRKEKAILERSFNTRLAKETNRLLGLEKAKQQNLMADLKIKLEKQANQKIDKSAKELSKDKAKFEREKKIQSNKYYQLNRQFGALQNKTKEEIGKREAKITALQEQLRKNQTPSELGFANERDMLKVLQEKFPADRFDHTGKGGDIIHYIRVATEEIGIIVYELKKVSNFSNSHIAQTLTAKQQRNADYAVLVTTAKRSKKDFGFSISKSVIIIHPAGALTIIAILREHLVTISKLKLSNKEREEAVKVVLEYIQGPEFKNSLEGIIDNTMELYVSMKKEVKEHISAWQERFDRYSDINFKAATIENRVINLIAPSEKGKNRLVKDTRISPIELPAEIK